MRVRAVAAAIAVAALLISGCKLTTLPEPAGIVAPLAKKEKWEGVWVNDKTILLLFVDDAEKGVLRYCDLERTKKKEGPPARLQCFAAQLRIVGGDYVLNIATDELYPSEKSAVGEPAARRWHFLLLRRADDRVFLWMFDGTEAEKLAKAGKLEGKVVDGKMGTELHIDRLDHGLLKRWASGEDAGFLWKLPIVFDYGYPLELQ